MTDFRHIDPEDLALHAMGLLSAEEAAVIEAQLSQDGEARAEFLRAQQDLSVLALTVEQTAPAPEARARFLQQVSREKRVAPIAPVVAMPSSQNVVAMPATRQSGGILPWLGWAVAAGLALAAVPMYQEHSRLEATVADQSAQLKAQTAQVATMSADASKAKAIMDTLTDANAMRVTLNTTPAAKALPQGRATYLADKGALVFTASNLEPLPIAKVYELWIIPADGTAPVPAGTFRPDGRGNANVVMPEIPKGVQAKAFGVTMEAEGGSKKPTLPILMVGA